MAKRDGVSKSRKRKRATEISGNKFPERKEIYFRFFVMEKDLIYRKNFTGAGKA